MPASSRALSRSFPAGPTNGLPCRSSWSPGCSPTNITSAFDVPSPKTVCVPVSCSGQAVQPAAASLSFGMLGLSGTSGAAVSSSVSCLGTTLAYPRLEIFNATIASRGAVAEWLGRGLQSLVHQFDSGRRLYFTPVDLNPQVVLREGEVAVVPERPTTVRQHWAMRIATVGRRTVGGGLAARWRSASALTE